MTNSINSFSYLDDKAVHNWSRMVRWTKHEAIMLSLGLNPMGKGDVVDKGKVSDINDEIQIRFMILDRFNEDEIQKVAYDAANASLSGNYNPRTFVQWAKQYFPSFPQALYEAVERSHNVNEENGQPESSGNTEQTEQAAADLLMSEAEQLIDSAQKTKRVSDSIHAKNASGPRQHIRYAKVQAAYWALLSMRQGCTCISRDLEKVVYNAIHEDVRARYPEIKEDNLKEYYIKEAVNLVMKTDSEVITRIFKLKDHWDNKWLEIECKLPGHKF